ncbi:armadillo-type protein [Entophlyctis helioformis]|nr:armadillo-type protein [Entophlyctis helioformis]
MTMNSIADILAASLSPNQATLNDAQAKMEAMSAENYLQYLGLLCQELVNEQQQSSIRQLAGLSIKNTLSAKDPLRQAEYTARWIQLDASFRAQIKAALLHTLSSADPAPGTAAGQGVAAIGHIELPRNEAKQVALQTIGFVCEGTDPDVLSVQSNAILTAVAQGARKEEPSDAVRLTALKALCTSLEFIRENMDREGERNYVMLIVCEATQSENAEIQVAAFECLVKIMTLYYGHMVHYMQKALYGLTTMGMRHQDENVVLQAIEFWSSVAETEIGLISEQQECAEIGVPFEGEYFNFAQAAAPQIMPTLLWLMTKREEDDEDDDWTQAMSAATCLSLYASCVGSPIVAHVLPFIQENIQNADWRFRDAAVMAFGSILDGPEPSELGGLIQAAFPTLIQLMSDPFPQVKDSAAWTLSRICEFLIQFIKPEQFPSLVSALLNGLSDSPRVASSCAWSLVQLADHTASSGDDSPGTTSAISPYYEAMILALSQAGERSVKEPHVCAGIYEAMATLVTLSPLDCQGHVSNLTRAILERLGESINNQGMIVGTEDRRAHYEFQANLCSVLMAVIRRVGHEINQISDQIMATMLNVIANASKNSTVMEDAFLVVSALANVMEGNFIRYMDSFTPFLYSAMQNYEEYSLCKIALGLVGDICRALNEGVLPYCDNFMSIVGALLQNNNVNSVIRPVSLGVLADLALAISGKFEVYLQPAMAAIHQITLSVQYMPAATIEQLNFRSELNEAISDAYVGILQGLKADDRSALLRPYANQVLLFIKSAAQDPERGESLYRSIVGLLGDLAETLPPGSHAGFNESWINDLFREIKTDRQASPETKELTKWARDIVRRQTMA